LRAPGPRGRPRRDRRVVRDAGQGGEVARRPLRQGPAASQGGRLMKLAIAGARDFSQDKHAMEYDNPQFWDSAHLQSEMHRVFELCYECKLCYPKCPYVPPHEFAVDFPRLMLRSKMIDAREGGIAFREKFLGATDLVGSVMTKIAPLANAAAHNSFNRMLMDKTIGIARDRQLPDYADESFETWWKRRAPKAGDGTAVALFHTCFVNYNDPEIGKDAVAMLEKAGCAVDCPEQVCCGMPKLDGGDLEGARKLAERNVETLL